MCVNRFHTDVRVNILFKYIQWFFRSFIGSPKKQKKRKKNGSMLVFLLIWIIIAAEIDVSTFFFFGLNEYICVLKPVLKLSWQIY